LERVSFQEKDSVLQFKGTAAASHLKNSKTSGNITRKGKTC